MVLPISPQTWLGACAVTKRSRLNGSASVMSNSPPRAPAPARRCLGRFRMFDPGAGMIARMLAAAHLTVDAG
jgi:hypothetical protein